MFVAHDVSLSFRMRRQCTGGGPPLARGVMSCVWTLNGTSRRRQI